MYEPDDLATVPERRKANARGVVLKLRQAMKIMHNVRKYRDRTLEAAFVRSLRFVRHGFKGPQRYDRLVAFFRTCRRTQR